MLLTLYFTQILHDFSLIISRQQKQNFTDL